MSHRHHRSHKEEKKDKKHRTPEVSTKTSKQPKILLGNSSQSAPLGTLFRPAALVAQLGGNGFKGSPSVPVVFDLGMADDEKKGIIRASQSGDRFTVNEGGMYQVDFNGHVRFLEAPGPKVTLNVNFNCDRFTEDIKALVNHQLRAGLPPDKILPVHFISILPLSARDTFNVTVQSPECGELEVFPKTRMIITRVAF